MDRELPQATAETSRDFALKRSGADNPLECFAAIERMPDPAGVRRNRTGRARVNPIWVRRMDPERLFKSGAADAGNDRVTERRQIRRRRNIDVRVRISPA